MLNKLISSKSPKSRVSEAYRTLRTNIQFSTLDDDIKSIVVTSSGPGEGKSITMANLAITIAQSGKKVLLMDCDFRKPTVHVKFDFPNAQGLINVLAQDKKFEEVVITTDVKNLYVITSGPVPPNPAELLGTKKMKALLNELTKTFDMVLMDAPPVLAVTDAQILSTIADRTIIVAAYGESDKRALVEAKESIEKVGSKILGIVINKVPEKANSYYGKYY